MSGTILSVDELHAHLHDPGWVTVDCRHSLADFSLGRELYETAHIPGALFADVERDLAGPKTGTNGRHPLPDRDRFVDFLRSLGTQNDSRVIAYDAGSDMFAARLWFLCRWIGHDGVAVLDGGITAWQARGYETTAEPTPPPERGTIAAAASHARVVDANYVLAHLGSPRLQVLDARASDRFAGENETVDPVAGHIPGALNRPFKNNFDSAGLWKLPATLRAEFQALGADPAAIVHQCGSGVSASVNALAMAHAGLEGSKLYAGSWSEWIADPTRPKATGA